MSKTLYHWATGITYEGVRYDVCISENAGHYELDEVRVHDSGENIIALIQDHALSTWFYHQAMHEITRPRLHPEETMPIGCREVKLWDEV